MPLDCLVNNSISLQGMNIDCIKRVNRMNIDWRKLSNIFNGVESETKKTRLCLKLYPEELLRLNFFATQISFISLTFPEISTFNLLIKTTYSIWGHDGLADIIIIIIFLRNGWINLFFETKIQIPYFELKHSVDILIK